MTVLHNKLTGFKQKVRRNHNNQCDKNGESKEGPKCGIKYEKNTQEILPEDMV